MFSDFIKIVSAKRFSLQLMLARTVANFFLNLWKHINVTIASQSITEPKNYNKAVWARWSKVMSKDQVAAISQ